MRQQGGGPSEARPFWPALDGLRALAVTLVLVSHLGSEVLPEGGIGVDVFFVLSGFLITHVIVTEWRGSGGSFGYGRFYIRRALRLVPALVVMLIGVVLAFVVLDVVDDAVLRDDTLNQVPAAATYTLNWFMAWNEWPATPLTHTWSLAVEEQFYLVWPVAVLLLLRRTSPKITIVVTIVLVGALFLAGAVDVRLTQDYGRLYYATQYRLPQMLAGATLALVLVFVRVPRLKGRWTAWVAAAAIAGLVVMAQWPDALPKMEYLRQPIVTVLAGSVVWAMVVAGDATVFRPFLVRPVLWVGRRSYGIYLYHLPILVAMHRLGWTVTARVAIGIPLVLVVAALSWRFVESPALRLKQRFEPPVPSGAPAAAGRG